MTDSPWIPPEQPTASAAPPGRRAWWRWHWLHLVAVFIVGAMVGGAGAVPDEPADPAAQPAPAATVTVYITPTPAPTPTPVAAASPTVARTTAPPAPRTYAEFRGTTAQRTRAFDVPDGAEWEICYDMRGQGNNSIWLESPPGQKSDLIVNTIGPVKACTQQFDGGRFSLDVGTRGSWSVTVREQR